MGTHPIFESDFDCLTDIPQMNPEESSDSDAPLDQLVRAEIQRQDDYYNWVEQSAREALGKNHRAEMEDNFGIARNRRRQRQEEYAAVVKELKKPTNASDFFPRQKKELKNGEKRRKMHTKQEAESSDDEIQVEQKIRKMKLKAPKRTRKTSAPPIVPEKVKTESMTPENPREAANRERLVAEQLKKNQQRAATIATEIAELEAEKMRAIEDFDAKIERKREIIATIKKFDSKLVKNGFNTPPKKTKPEKRRRRASNVEIVISDGDDNNDNSQPVWQQS